MNAAARSRDHGSSTGCSAAPPARVLERPFDEPRAELAEGDPRGLRGPRQEAVRGHTRDRVHLERDHTVAEPNEVGPRHATTVERAMSAQPDVLRALRDLGWDACRDDLLALAGVVLRVVVEEFALRHDLDHRKCLWLVVPDHRDGELRAFQILLDESTVVVFKGPSDSGRKIFRPAGDRRPDAGTAPDPFPEHRQPDRPR